MSAAKKKSSEPKADHMVAESEAVSEKPRNGAPGKIELPLHRRMDSSFLQYASYVIRDRAIPNLSDGLKPVQRRILWSLHEKDGARFIKVATIAGHCAQDHTHGDVSIGDALDRVPADRAGAPRDFQRRDYRLRAQLRRTQQRTGGAAGQAPDLAHARH